MLHVIILFVLLISLIGAIVYARWNYGTLEKLGIPVVKPSFILGSTPDLHLKVAHYEDIKRFRKYGKIYGVYEGRTPQIHVCDPTLIRLIFSKDSDHFYNRRVAELGDPILNELLDFTQDEKWKVTRTALTPSLSSSRIKAAVAVTKVAASEFTQRLKLQVAQSPNGKLRMDVRERIAGLVMDYMAQASFGIKIGDSDDPQNYFVKLFREVSGNDKEFGLMYNLSLTFPLLSRLSPTLDNSGSAKLAETFREAMRQRELGNGPKVNDLADKLNEMISLLHTPEYKRLGITENTVMAQAVGAFLLAGYDSIITGIVFLFYYLASYPQIQDGVRAEIRKFFKETPDSEITLDSLLKLPYLRASIMETLRLVPPFIRPERICTKDWSYENLHIKKGTIVMLPAWAYHRDPETYPNPDDFNPERFLGQEKKSLDNYAFSTFGFGPRNCPGSRFANETMTICSAYILRDIKFTLSPDTLLKYKPGVLFLIMYDPIYLNAQIDS